MVGKERVEESRAYGRRGHIPVVLSRVKKIVQRTS